MDTMLVFVPSCYRFGDDSNRGVPQMVRWYVRSVFATAYETTVGKKHQPSRIVKFGKWLKEAKMRTRNILSGIIAFAVVFTLLAVPIITPEDYATYAWFCDGDGYHFTMSRDGHMRVVNDSDNDEPAQQADVFINGDKVKTVNVPAVEANTSANIGDVETPGDEEDEEFDWEIEGNGDCASSGHYDRVIQPPIEYSLRVEAESTCNGYNVTVHTSPEGAEISSDHPLRGPRVRESFDLTVTARWHNPNHEESATVHIPAVEDCENPPPPVVVEEESEPEAPIEPYCVFVVSKDLVGHYTYARWRQGDGNFANEWLNLGPTTNIFDDNGEITAVSFKLPPNARGTYGIWFKYMMDNPAEPPMDLSQPPYFLVDADNCTYRQPEQQGQGGGNYCAEPSIYQRLNGDGITEIRLLTVGNLHPTTYRLTDGETNSLDGSLSTSGQHFAYVQQNSLSWQLWVAETENPENRTLVYEGLVRNPAINEESELVAYEVIDDTGEWSIEIRNWGGELLRSLSNASQPFWFDEQTFGFVRNGRIYSTSVESVRVRAITPATLEASEPVTSDGNVIAYTAGSLVIMQNLETGETVSPAGDQPALNADGTRMVYRNNGHLWVYDAEIQEITQLTNITGAEIENPVWYCNATVFFEDGGEIFSVAYWPGATRTRAQLLVTSGNPEEQPSFAASVITTREHVRNDWTIAQTAMEQTENEESASTNKVFVRRNGFAVM